MCIYRSYFEKNNTLIFNSELNTAKNQVSEIIYGENPSIFSRYIFKIDLNNLINKVNSQQLTEDRVSYHKLKIFNTINQQPEKFLNTNFNNEFTKLRASSFKLILYKIDEEWDEGSGYDFNLNKNLLLNPKNTSGSNWFNKKTNEPWDSLGSFTGNTENIITTINFDNGDENIEVDITDYINNIIFNGYENNGIGIAYSEEFETLTDIKLNVVGFHTKYTTTIYEPFIESKFNLEIQDDRNIFKLDNLNKLYFYGKKGQTFLDITIPIVKIYNHKYELIKVFSDSDIKKQSKGIFYIEFELDSSDNIDSVLYYDEWTVLINGEEKIISNEFYVAENNSNFFIESSLPKNMLNISFSGILNKDKIKRGENLVIDLLFKKLYNQDNTEPFNLEYRIYIPQSNKKELEIIPFTKVNRAPNKYFILLDTEFLIPSIYRIELKLNNLDYSIRYEELEFIVVD